MLIGYIRNSFLKEDTHLHSQELKNFGCTKIYTDEVNDADILKRPNFEKMLKQAKNEDSLVVCKLANLGVGMFGFLKLMDELKNRQIHFISLKEGFDTREDAGNYLFKVVAAFAEMERELNTERINVGLAASRAKGIIGGRKPSMDQNSIDKALTLLKQGKTPAEVMTDLEIKKSTFYATIDVKNLKQR